MLEDLSLREVRKLAEAKDDTPGYTGFPGHSFHTSSKLKHASEMSQEELKAFRTSDADVRSGTPLPPLRTSKTFCDYLLSIPKSERVRKKLPWLVKERDLRRYLGRALDACKSGRVVFFYHQFRGTRRLLAIAPYPDVKGVLPAARELMAIGKWREVVLADLPRRKQ